MNVDKIFVINLECRRDRKEYMINELRRNEITNYEFFKGIRPTLDDVKEWNNEYCYHVKNQMLDSKFDKYRIGCLGCLRSHVEICKLSLERGYKRVLILEDDIEFKNDYKNVEKSMKDIKNDFDILYLSGSHLGTIENISENTIQVNGTHTTGSYIIDEKIMRYIISNIEGYEKEIDVFYSEKVQPKMRCYCCIPHITRQIVNYSDIQQNIVNYKF